MQVLKDIFGFCLWPALKKPAKPREIVCVPYTAGDAMLKLNEGWRLAPEEDTNQRVGWVYLERDANEVPK